MVDTMNEAFNSNHLSKLSSPSRHAEYCKEPKILPTSILFAKAPTLLFHIPAKRDKLVNLHVDDFICIYLYSIVKGLCKATRCFHVITNVFNLFFNPSAADISNSLTRACALSLRNL